MSEGSPEWLDALRQFRMRHRAATEAHDFVEAAKLAVAFSAQCRRCVADLKAIHGLSVRIDQ